MCFFGVVTFVAIVVFVIIIIKNLPFTLLRMQKIAQTGGRGGVSAQTNTQTLQLLLTQPAKKV